MNRSASFLVLSIATLVLSCGKGGSSGGDTSGGGVGGGTTTTTGTYFNNPLLSSGPDPWVIQKDGKYYFTKTAVNKLLVYPTAKMSQLNLSTPQTVWTPPATGAYSADIWAPEIHYLNNKWYMYFAADDGNDANHRMFVLESSDATPATTNWTFKGKLTPTTDKWAIDGTILNYNNQLYMIWSGWRSDNQSGLQQLYIAKMKDPYTIDGDRVLISEPTYSWEKNGSAINEGPEILTNSQGGTFLIYSASSCSTDDYCMGMLTLKTGGDPMNPADWTKAATPVFTKNIGGNTFGPGHCAFFKSVDTKEDWILYHANPISGQGCGDSRSPRIQKFTFNADGTPNFGPALSAGVNLLVPSGE